MLAGSVVAVIGASGGLGRPICASLTARGAQLMLVGPHRDRLSSVASDLQSVSPQATPQASAPTIVECDIRDAQFGDLIVTAARAVGRLDGVINAAGVVGFGTLLETPDELIEELFLTNVLGPLWMLRRVAPLLSESKGFVVNISAVVAESPLANMAAYSASKAALTAADAALQREFRRIGVSVLDVRPPHTETGLATRPITGQAPKMPQGLAPEFVAELIVSAIEAETSDLGSTAFMP
jgi:short-subunit dehydrogenase